MSDQALVTRPKGGIGIAESDRTARPGEIVFVDADGKAMNRRAVSMAGLKAPVLIGLAWGLAGGVLGGPFAIGGALATLVLWTVHGRRIRPYLVAHSQLLAGDLDGTEAALAQLPDPAGGIRAALRAGTLAWAAYGRGQNARAIELFERSLRLSGRDKIRTFTSQVGLADVLARTGQLDRAKQVRAETKLPANAAAMLEVSLGGVDLTLALVEGKETALDQEEIDRWTRMALEINNTAAILAKLARVHAARGDDELADHLAREARDRFTWCPMAYWPELDAWLAERLASQPADPLADL